MPFYTDYPFTALGDTAGQLAPVREVELIHWDSDKYVTVRVAGIEDQIKWGYVYTTARRLDDPLSDAEADAQRQAVLAKLRTLSPSY